MKAIGKWTLAVAALAAVAVPARGQDRDKPDAGRKVELVRLGDMIGKDIHYRDLKTEVGTVKDVVVDLQRGRAAYAVVARKDDSSKVHAVPVNKFRAARSPDGKKFEALMLEDDKVWNDCPHVTKDEWDKADRMTLGQLASKEGADSLARASQVMKASVVDSAGERIGEIDEIMVNLDNSRLLALVGVGGVLGVGERRHVVPWEILRVRETKKDAPASFTLNVPKDRLEKGPILGKDEENRLGDPTWVAGLYEHYQYGPLGGERRAFRCVTAEEFLGSEVASTGKPDDEFGSIEAVAIVPHTGQIAYVALDVDGKLYAVPLDAFKVSLNSKGEVKKVLMDGDKSMFKGKQPFDQDRWPDRADTSWKTSGADRETDGVAPLVLRSSDVLDADVKDSRRVTFGEIEGFVLDLDHAKILYVCVGSGGFLGIGETTYAVPWKAMKWSGDKDKFFTVNADRKTLERSVEFDGKRYADEGWIRSVYGVYGLDFDKKFSDKKMDPNERKTQP